LSAGLAAKSDDTSAKISSISFAPRSDGCRAAAVAAAAIVVDEALCPMPCRASIRARRSSSTRACFEVWR
jgi:hypothetical protein